MEIKRAVECGDDIREKISEVYVNAFYNNVLKHFSKDKAKLIKAFAHGFELEYFYVAIIDNEIAGITACMGKGQFCFKIKTKTLIKHLGIFKGLFAGFEFNQFRMASPKLDKNTALIEYVATSEKHLRKGVASALVKYLLTLPEYEFYVVEVDGTNAKAVSLYYKLGFRAVSMKIYVEATYVSMRYAKKQNNGVLTNGA
jgi:ribosomal protein S18 acetylase RimI-like enzyme